MHQPGVSHYLEVLRDAGLVEVRQDAQRPLYRLRPEPLIELDAWLEPCRVEWTARLDSLEHHLRRIAEPIRPRSLEIAARSLSSTGLAIGASQSGGHGGRGHERRPYCAGRAGQIGDALARPVHVRSTSRAVT